MDLEELGSGGRSRGDLLWDLLLSGSLFGSLLLLLV